MLASMIYAVVRVLVDAVAVSNMDRPELEAEVLALRRQVQVLERQIKRVQWSPGDRMVLAVLGRLLPKASWAGLLVKPETVLGWHRDLVRRKWAAYRRRPRHGRPPLKEEVRELIVRMAKENPTWGYFRIRGELMKLGHQVAATTIRSVLIKSKVPPAGKRSGLTWKRFLAAHAESLIATDFLSVDTIFFKRLYVLFFLHLATRRVIAAISTTEPNEQWMSLQARNLSMQLAEEGRALTVGRARPGYQVLRELRLSVDLAGCAAGPDTADGPDRERLRGALGGFAATGVSRLDVDRLRAAPCRRPPGVLGPLQRRTAASQP